MYRIISLFILCVLALTEAKITTCESPVGHVDRDHVEITNCRPDDKKCILKLGTDVTFAFNFTINKPVKSVRAVVHGQVFVVSVPFDLVDADVCAYSNTTGIHCPLSSTCNTYHYSTSLHIDSGYPKFNVDVTWELKNEDDENIVCLVIPAKLR